MAGFSRALLPLVLSVLFLLALLPISAFANGGPAEWAGNEYGGTLLPVKNDSVSVVSEYLIVDFSKKVGEGTSQVPVRATYRIRNEADSQRAVLIGFPYWWTSHHGYSPGMDFEPRFQAALDGVPLQVESAEMDLPQEKAPAGEGMLRDLWTGSGWKLRAIAFEVQLGPGEERILDVSYLQRVGSSAIDHSWDPLLQIDYILSTARYWKKFGDLEIEVVAPHGLQVASNLPLSLVEGEGINRYVFRSPSLPDTNLRVAVGRPLPTDRVILRTVGGGNESQGRGILASLGLCLGVPVLGYLALIAFSVLRRLAIRGKLLLK